MLSIWISHTCICFTSSDKKVHLPVKKNLTILLSVLVAMNSPEVYTLSYQTHENKACALFHNQRYQTQVNCE